MSHTVMLTTDDIKGYQGGSLERGPGFLYVQPHLCLRPFVSNYTVSFPTPVSMPDAYTVLPTVSSTVVLSVNSTGIVSSLRGVNTVACNVGGHANKMKLLVLIEFHPGCLFHFLQIEQHELLNHSFSLSDLNSGFAHALENALESAMSIQGLFDALDSILLCRLSGKTQDPLTAAMMELILTRHGCMDMRCLSSKVHYSEKQMRRTFVKYVGTGPKEFARIARFNYAVQLLKTTPARHADIAAQTGYYDQPHFIHEFRAICGLMPQEYSGNMSVFYNDRFKM